MGSNPICVLIVESDVLLRDELSRLLSEKDCTVIRTSLPRLALEVVYTNPIPRWILVCGEDLPEISGSEMIVSSLLGSANLLGAILLTDVSGAEAEKNEKTALAARACAKAGVSFRILKKPLSADRVLEVLESIVSLSAAAAH